MSETGIEIGDISLLSAAFAVRSASSLPGIPQWPGTQQNITVLLIDSMAFNLAYILQTIGFLLSRPSIDCNNDKESQNMRNFFNEDT